VLEPRSCSKASPNPPIPAKAQSGPRRCAPTERARALRFHRAAFRRASGRIRAEIGRAAGLVDRFSGSAGTAVVLAGRAAIFVDGRYTLQVGDQVDTAVFEPVSILETSVADWLKANTAEGQRIGYDPG
jgi:hypothetical protein